jgi:hypothetical protein
VDADVPGIEEIGAVDRDAGSVTRPPALHEHVDVAVIGSDRPQRRRGVVAEDGAVGRPEQRAGLATEGHGGGMADDVHRRMLPEHAAATDPTLNRPVAEADRTQLDA